jgi:hypothetical protein
MTKIRILSYEPDYDVIPQAVFWRPLHYFTMVIREGEDGLDRYNGASFTIGNDLRFDLRAYRGHPEFTVTLYLPEGVDDENEISEAIDRVIKEMVIPASAVAWRRGQSFEFGELTRPKGDRLREPEARLLALKIAAMRPNRTATTTLVKKEVPKYIELTKADLAPSTSRTRESRWQQIVGNIISHDKTRQGPFVRGYAVKANKGLEVTKKGVDYLNNLGFLVSSAA